MLVGLRVMAGGQAASLEESSETAARSRTELLKACVEGVANVPRTTAAGVAERVLTVLVTGDPHDESRDIVNALQALSVVEGAYRVTGAHEGGGHPRDLQPRPKQTLRPICGWAWRRLRRALQATSDVLLCSAQAPGDVGRDSVPAAPPVCPINAVIGQMRSPAARAAAQCRCGPHVPRPGPGQHTLPPDRASAWPRPGRRSTGMAPTRAVSRPATALSVDRLSFPPRIATHMERRPRQPEVSPCSSSSHPQAATLRGGLVPSTPRCAAAVRCAERTRTRSVASGVPVPTGSLWRCGSAWAASAAPQGPGADPPDTEGTPHGLAAHGLLSCPVGGGR